MFDLLLKIIGYPLIAILCFIGVILFIGSIISPIICLVWFVNPSTRYIFFQKYKDKVFIFYEWRLYDIIKGFAWMFWLASLMFFAEYVLSMILPVWNYVDEDGVIRSKYGTIYFIISCIGMYYIVTIFNAGYSKYLMKIENQKVMDDNSPIIIEHSFIAIKDSSIEEKYDGGLESFVLDYFLNYPDEAKNENLVRLNKYITVINFNSNEEYELFGGMMKEIENTMTLNEDYCYCIKPTLGEYVDNKEQLVDEPYWLKSIYQASKGLNQAGKAFFTPQQLIIEFNIQFDDSDRAFIYEENPEGEQAIFSQYAPRKSYLYSTDWKL